MSMLAKARAGLCYVVAGVVTLGVMVVIPIGWFFFDLSGPLERLLGDSFIWRLLDVVLWSVSTMLAMVITAAMCSLATKSAD